MEDIIKKLLTVLAFAFIGYFVGCAVSTGDQTYMNKTERKAHNSSGIPIVSGIIGALIGVFFSINIFQEDTRDKELGINDAFDEVYQKGRGWVLKTTWKNPVTGASNVIITDKHNYGELVTFFNGEVFLRHGVTSAAKKVVYNSHVNARYELFKKIRAGDIKQL